MGRVTSTLQDVSGNLRAAAAALAEGENISEAIPLAGRRSRSPSPQWRRDSSDGNISDDGLGLRPAPPHVEVPVAEVVLGNRPTAEEGAAGGSGEVAADFPEPVPARSIPPPPPNIRIVVSPGPVGSQVSSQSGIFLASA